MVKFTADALALLSLFPRGDLMTKPKSEPNLHRRIYSNYLLAKLQQQLLTLSHPFLPAQAASSADTNFSGMLELAVLERAVLNSSPTTQIQLAFLLN